MPFVCQQIHTTPLKFMFQMTKSNYYKTRSERRNGFGGDPPAVGVGGWRPPKWSLYLCAHWRLMRVYIYIEITCVLVSSLILHILVYLDYHYKIPRFLNGKYSNLTERLWNSSAFCPQKICVDSQCQLNQLYACNWQPLLQGLHLIRYVIVIQVFYFWKISSCD